ncbi:MAG: hypothetical protein RL701_1133 [Pseudomonadota bacterium]
MLLCTQLPACRKSSAPAKPQTNAKLAAPPAPAPKLSVVSELASVEPVTPVEAMVNPVPLWENGQTKRFIDADKSQEQGYLVLDLGENWTPYLFTDGVDAANKPLPNAFRPTYLALARGDFPNDLHGERAKTDKYLELYGILPTLSVLRTRMADTARRTCADAIDLTPFLAFRGLVTYSDNSAAKRAATQFAIAEAAALESMSLQAVATPETIDLNQLSTPIAAQVVTYLKALPQWRALDALQRRLQCEGYLTPKAKFLPGFMDWTTHSALAEYERRNGVFSMGYLGKDSLTPLRSSPHEVEREAVLRLLTERALHTAAVLEDGSVEAFATSHPDEPHVFIGNDGAEHPIPNLAARMRETLQTAFGLDSPETTLGWLSALGELPADQHRFVAVKMLELPEYYAPEMELTLDYDRGDVWYDFPYDDKGKEVPQPVSHRPHVTVSTFYNGQKIPLARFGTTIGGWRTERIENDVLWKYKDSPVGERAWAEIVAAPVWLPPDTTPHEDLLRKNYSRTSPSDPEYFVNYHETGPGYASAYGLVAAYHRTFARRADGRILLGHDEGIRTHGSVDYMSIMRRHSHGCHRLHNHVAMRLMSFVLAHRAHERRGQEAINFARFLVVKDQTYRMEMHDGGYVFKLKNPLIVNVEEGRIRGTVKAPIEIAMPRWNPDKRAYVTREGNAVKIRGNQLIPSTFPPPLTAANDTRGRSSALLVRTAGAVASRTTARTVPNLPTRVAAVRKLTPVRSGARRPADR